jgi:hypothetical protein
MVNQPNDAAFAAALLSNRELAEAVERQAVRSRDPHPGCTPEQQQAAREACDWIVEHPLLCAVAAVAVFVLSVLASMAYPLPWGLK